MHVLIILIVPDRNKDTISSARALWPRFVAFADSDFGDMAAVLGKMLERLGSRITEEEQYEGGK